MSDWQCWNDESEHEVDHGVFEADSPKEAAEAYVQDRLGLGRRFDEGEISVRDEDGKLFSVYVRVEWEPTIYCCAPDEVPDAS